MWIFSGNLDFIFYVYCEIWGEMKIFWGNLDLVKLANHWRLCGFLSIIRGDYRFQKMLPEVTFSDTYIHHLLIRERPKCANSILVRMYSISSEQCEYQYSTSIMGGTSSQHHQKLIFRVWEICNRPAWNAEDLGKITLLPTPVLACCPLPMNPEPWSELIRSLCRCLWEYEE